MSRRVVVSEGASTLNDRFRRIQEDFTDKRREHNPRRTRPQRIVIAANRPSSRGVTKPRGGTTRIISNSVPAYRGGRTNGGSAAINRTRDLAARSSSNTSRGRFLRGGRGTRGGREGRGRGREVPKKDPPTNKENLDKELDAYMFEDKEKGKEFLDTDLDDYMALRDSTGAEEEDQEHQED